MPLLIAQENNHKILEPISSLHHVSKFPIENLLKKFNELESESKNSNLTEKFKVEVEQDKLGIMMLFLTYLSEESEISSLNEIVETNLMEKKIATYFFVSCGLLLESAGSFVFAHDILKLIPCITAPIVLASTLLLMACNSCLFYSFEVTMLKKAFGISEMKGDAENYFNICTQQINLTKQITSKILDITFIDNLKDGEYAKYIEFAKALDFNVVYKKNNIKWPKEALALKLIKNIIIGFGACMEIAGGYYFINHMLMIIAPSVIGTPAGWIIVGIGIISALAFFIAMRASGIAGMTDTTLQEAKGTLKELRKYKSAESKLNQAKEIQTKYARLFNTTNDNSRSETHPCKQKPIMSVTGR